MQLEIDVDEADYQVALAVVELSAEADALSEQAKHAGTKAEADALESAAKLRMRLPHVAEKTGLHRGLIKPILEGLGVTIFLGYERFGFTDEQFAYIESVAAVRLVSNQAPPTVTNNSVTVHGSHHQVSAGGNVVSRNTTASDAIAGLGIYISQADWTEEKRTRARLALRALAGELGLAEVHHG